MELKAYEEHMAKARAEWVKGPWNDEPDRVEWRHNGVPCLIVRNMSGGLCGYAGVAPGHPLHGLDYGQESPALAEALEKRKGEPIGPQPGMGIMLALLSGEISATPEVVLNVHGGITYAEGCKGAICHVPQPGESDNTWWFGFDCAHSGDITPSDETYAAKRGEPYYGHKYGGSYKGLAYVKAETERLAEQLAALG